MSAAVEEINAHLIAERAALVEGLRQILRAAESWSAQFPPCHDIEAIAAGLLKKAGVDLEDLHARQAIAGSWPPPRQRRPRWLGWLRP